MTTTRASESLSATAKHCSTAALAANRTSVLDALKQRGLWSEPNAEPRQRIVRPINIAMLRARCATRLCVLIQRALGNVAPTARLRPLSGIWKGIVPLPYRLPELLGDPDAVVYITEGEKDADNLAEIGIVATCNHGGAGKWRNEISQWLKNRNVVILPDNDDAGRSHANDVAKKLTGIAASIRILELTGLPPKGDVSDWLDAGGNGR